MITPSTQKVFDEYTTWIEQPNRHGFRPDQPVPWRVTDELWQAINGAAIGLVHVGNTTEEMDRQRGPSNQMAEHVAIACEGMSTLLVVASDDNNWSAYVAHLDTALKGSVSYSQWVVDTAAKASQGGWVAEAAALLHLSRLWLTFIETFLNDSETRRQREQRASAALHRLNPMAVDPLSVEIAHMRSEVARLQQQQAAIQTGVRGPGTAG